ncbi:MAG TPA: DNA-binding response regulator, partial [Pseudomonas sp.]|nr:DNA-binding response regulator [Pseudomonas sp.]
EAQCLHNALLSCQGNINQVMEMLRLPRRTLNEKMQRHGLQRSTYRPAGSVDDE